MADRDYQHSRPLDVHCWSEHTDISYEIAEMIIAHQVGSQVERAYNRTDYLEQRRHYMELWSVFVTSEVQR